MRYEIRELEVGGILDQAIKLTKDHFWLYLKIAFVLLVPFNILAGLLVQWNMPDVPAVVQPGMYARAELPGNLLTIMAITGLINGIIVYPLTDAALIYAIANSYLQRPIGVGIAFRRALHIFLPLVGTWILMYLIIVFGLILFIIPGIIFMYRYLLATRVVVIEGVSGSAALKRSKQLIKGSGGTLFVLTILVFVIGAGIGWVTNFIQQVELKIIVQSVIQSVYTVFATAAMVVFYFSCRCKTENFDLQLLAEAVGKDEPPALSTSTL